MRIKDFIEKFNFDKPDFTLVPEGFPKCDLGGLTSSEVGKFTAILSFWDLQKPVKSESRSRVWQDPKGYQYLGVWPTSSFLSASGTIRTRLMERAKAGKQNAALLRVLIRKFTLTLSLNRTLNQPLEFRLKAQLDDAARSVKRNIEEGWKRPTTAEYLTFLGYSQASLEEVKGDIRDAKTDGFLKSVPGSGLIDLGFDLSVFMGPNKGAAKGEPTDPGHPYHMPLTNLDPKSLTYEMFIELINKTDWLLRKLVEALENKLDADQKGYLIEKMRIRGRVMGRY